ncbi:hydroxylysine kinase [Anopheles aquasalis]|uniref:hydroxylysine kinase n=1 Tax=Anopheles aquasalis TaxID=42839 RepID=UPI00215A60F7|nr:hydroxylysine kinase [Anopheles aquasalis]XP_050100234.1 hydroxylysine kinase [Anopheles aquasalis]
MEMKTIVKKRSITDADPAVGADVGGDSSETQEEIDSTVDVHEPEAESTDTLKPGSAIRPIISEEEVRKLAERLYGIIVLEMCELDSYDDRNFMIQADSYVKNPILKSINAGGYVMKIANSLDSQDESFFEAQNEIMLHLSKREIKCPVPVQNIYGKFYSLEKLAGSQHVLRLLEYIPGKVFHGVPHPDRLFYQAGQFIARIDSALKSVDKAKILNRQSIWMLESFPKLKDFLYVIKDEHHKDIIEQVLDAFNRRIVPNLHEFQQGVIYGDFNEHNIIVNKKASDSKEYEITGIIDFGDVCYSRYVFELAIAMTYMILESNDLDTGGLVMAGYSMIRIIPPHEKDVLRVAIAARLCQSLVMGLYTATVDSSNQYILSTQVRGWNMLEALWKETDKYILERWATVAEEYLTRSTK